MKFENTVVFNFAGAMRGMRNPLESWEKSDTDFENYELHNDLWAVEIGKADIDLAQRLIKAGSEHRKFLRQIFVSVDIIAPLYWWKETDQYRIGITTNSCSTMHKLASTPITMDCFEMDDFAESVPLSGLSQYIETVLDFWNYTITALENLRQWYNRTKDKRCWKELIRLLPESWLQKRTVTMNYENVLNMVHQRKNHKLTEWSKSFIDWAKTLPYAEELLFVC